MPIAQLSSPLLADQAADFSFVVTWSTAGTPVDLSSGWSAKFAWQPNTGSTPADLTSSSGGGLTLGSDGTITGLVPAATTTSWSFGTLKFELFVTSPTGAVDVLLSGSVACAGSFQ